MNWVERFEKHLEKRRLLRELVEGSDLVFARVFGEQGSTMMKAEGGVFGIDGMFGQYAQDGGRVDIVGLNKDRSVRSIVGL